LKDARRRGGKRKRGAAEKSLRRKKGSPPKKRGSRNESVEREVEKGGRAEGNETKREIYARLFWAT
jgi:hypothetical protein